MSDDQLGVCYPSLTVPRVHLYSISVLFPCLKTNFTTNVMGSFVLEEKVPLLPLQNGDLQQEVKVKPLGYCEWCNVSRVIREGSEVLIHAEFSTVEVPRAVKGAYAATRVGSEEQYFEVRPFTPHRACIGQVFIPLSVMIHETGCR